MLARWKILRDNFIHIQKKDIAKKKNIISKFRCRNKKWKFYKNRTIRENEACVEYKEKRESGI